MPDRAARESIHHWYAEVFSGARRAFHFLGRAGSDALRLSVAPHVRWKNRLMACIDQVAHCLPDQMVTDREHIQSVRSKQLTLRHTVARVVRGANDVEVVSPAGKLEPVVSPIRRLFRECGQREVCPLSSKERHGSAHRFAHVGGE